MSAGEERRGGRGGGGGEAAALRLGGGFVCFGARLFVVVRFLRRERVQALAPASLWLSRDSMQRIGAVERGLGALEYQPRGRRLVV